MLRYLVQHVIKKTKPRAYFRFSIAIKIDCHFNFCFIGVSREWKTFLGGNFNKV